MHVKDYSPSLQHLMIFKILHTLQNAFCETIYSPKWKIERIRSTDQRMHVNYCDELQFS